MYAVAINANRFATRTTPARKISGSTLLFAGVLVYVAAVSAYDGYLVIRTGDMILEFERNPVGTFLIQCHQGDPTLFLGAKAAGTMIVLTVLSLLYHRKERLAQPVAYALCAFQSGLLVFLELG